MSAEVVDALMRFGGVARRHELVAATSRGAVDTALRDGTVTRSAHGVYTCGATDEARERAARLGGVVSHLSAALSHGWAVKRPPDRPHVTLPRNRKLRTPATDVRLHRADLGPDDVRGQVTSVDRTLTDVLRHEEFDSALAVADSALRAGITPQRLQQVATQARGPGAAAVRRVVGQASELAANPFESVLRAIALDVSGLNLRPQVPLWADEFLGKPDLCDRDLGIVVEADSFEWHGGRERLVSDCRRYNRFAVYGWLVLRFSWEDVMFHPEDVRRTLERAVRERCRVNGRT